jgi:hypothetical protein
LLGEREPETVTAEMGGKTQGRWRGKQWDPVLEASGNIENQKGGNSEDNFSVSG